MFKIDELVVYGGTGVCKIVDIGTPDFSRDEDKKYYYLKPIYKSGCIYQPVDNENIAMRHVISKDEAKSLLDSIGDVRTEIFKGRSMQQLTAHYQKIIDMHSCSALLKMTKSIYAKKCEAKKNNKRLGQIDTKFMRKAEELLFGEMAAVLDVDQEKIADYVYGKLDEEMQ